MKNLVLATSLLATLATGCIIESDDGGGDDGGNPTDTSLLTVNWRINTVGSTAALPCPPSAGNAILHYRVLDAQNNYVGSELEVNLGACSLGTAQVELDPEAYAVWLEIEGYAESPSWDEGMVDADRNDVADLVNNTTLSKGFEFQENGGYFAVYWQLEDGLTCAEAGAGGVSFAATLTSNNQLTDDVFNCEAGMGITAAVVEGQYVVSGVAIDASDEPLTTQPDNKNATMTAPNKTIMLPEFALLID